jgi:outer membrane protein
LRTKLVFIPALVLGGAMLAGAQTPAAAPTKVAIISVQDAILMTKDGQKAASDLAAKFAPKTAELDKKKSDISAMQDQYKKGSATLSEEAKAKLQRDIDSATKTLNRETEDAQADVEQEQGKLMQDLGGKIMKVIESYCNQNGIAVVLDVSSTTTPVLWAAAQVNITQEIVNLYDQANPGTGAAAAKPAAAPAARPAAPATKK